MKKLFFVIIVLNLGCFATAQTINISDKNFKAKLLEADSSNEIAKDLNGNWTKIDTNGDGEIQKKKQRI